MLMSFQMSLSASIICLIHMQNSHPPLAKFRLGESLPFHLDLNFKLMPKKNQLGRGKFLIPMKFLLCHLY